MTGRVAFYAPLKSPHHPHPSGDRTMAQQLLRALERAGFAPELASALRTLDKRGDPDLQERLRRESFAEADRLIADYRARPTAERPRLWFTYHLYYKAPDWIGPRVADALGMPYVAAEGSRASKRAGGPWALGHAGAEAALDRADVLFALTALDRAALERGRPPGQQIVDLPPFIDLAPWADWLGERRRADRVEPARLLTVAMMRPGDKLASYGLLADALARLSGEEWSLDIVGDGPARPDVEALFAPLGQRARFHGRVEDREGLARLYRGADLYLWPAVGEAYGMVLLEAQAFGCPVVAGAYGGVASVVRTGETGRLIPPGDPAAFAEAVAALIADPAERACLGAAAQQFVTRERDLDQAAERLRAALTSLLTDAVMPA